MRSHSVGHKYMTTLLGLRTSQLFVVRSGEALSCQPAVRREPPPKDRWQPIGESERQAGGARYAAHSSDDIIRTEGQQVVSAYSSADLVRNSVAAKHIQHGQPQDVKVKFERPAP